MGSSKHLPKTEHPLVIRTDFADQRAWETVCNLIRQPFSFRGTDFFAYVEFLDDPAFADLSEQDFLALTPHNFGHTFVIVVDKIATCSPEFPVLVIDLYDERGRTFRAIPSTVQAIENNLSMANMDFLDFADRVDSDGVFRGFRKP